jgi:hypothetical protein
MGSGGITGRTSFGTVNAVELDQVYDMEGSLIFRASPRIIQGLELIAGYVQHAAQH